MAAGGVERQRRDEQRGNAEGFVGGGRRVDDGGGAGAYGGAFRVHGDGPGDRPVRAQPFLAGPVGEQRGLDGAVVGDGAPAVRTVCGVLDVDVRAVLRAAQRPHGVRGFDHDLVEPAQGEQEGVVDRVEQPDHEVLGATVAQREDDDGVVPVGCGALGGQREPQQRYVAVAAAELVAEAGAGDGRAGGEVAGLGEGPADAAVPADDGGLVAHREHGGEPDAEPADGSLVALALGGGAQGGERFHAGGIDGGAGVDGGEYGGGVRGRRVQGEAEPPGDPGAGGGVGGVLGQLDDEAVTVAAEREVLLGVGVLAESGGACCPRRRARRVASVRSRTDRPPRSHSCSRSDSALSGYALPVPPVCA